MTDEEQKMLCEWLHNASVGWNGSQIIEPKMAQAAKEIERLAKENAQMRDMLLQFVAATADRIEAADTETIQ